MTLPATTFSEIIPMTKEQEEIVNSLIAQGWEVIALPEAIFNAAMLVEDTKGITHYVLPNGTIK